MTTRRKQNTDLHGNVPDSSPAVLILLDIINDLDFPGNSYLLRQVPRLAKHISWLKARCRQYRIPAVYVNDNWDRWRSESDSVVAHARQSFSPGRKLVESLLPDQEDYFVLKPKHSAFYSTPLDALLSKLNAQTVILVGLTTAACILLTAGEVYVRDFKLYVPFDCVAGLTRADHDKALALMRTSFRADTSSCRQLKLRRLARRE